MPVKAQLPDGTVLEFEDGTPDDVIDRVVQEHISGGAKEPAAPAPEGAPTSAEPAPAEPSGPNVPGFEKELGAYYSGLQGKPIDIPTVEKLGQKYGLAPTNLAEIAEFYQKYGTLNPRVQQEGPSAPTPPVVKPEEIITTVPRASENVQLARAFGKGALFDFADELEAAARMVASGELSTGEYYRIKDQINSDYNAWAKANPEEALAAELTGGIAGTFIPGIGLVGKGIKGGKALGSTILQGAKTGAQAGFLSGLGQSETLAPSDIIPSVATGTVLGGTAGGVFAKGAELGGRGFAAGKEELYKRLGMPQAGMALPEERKAAEILYGATAGGRSPERGVGLSALSGRYGVPTPLGLSTPELTSLTEKFLGKQTPGREAVARELVETQADSAQRVAGQVEAAFPGTRDYFEAGDAVTERLRQIGDQDYQKAYAVGEIRDPQIETLIKNPELASVWAEAQSLARLKGADLRMRMEPVLDEGGNLVGLRPTDDAIPNVEALDYFKRALDDRIDSGFRGTSSTGKGKAAALRDYIRKPLVARLDDLVPEYKEARSKYAGDMEVREALDLGRDMFSKRVRPQEVNKAMADMSVAEVEALRSGARQALFQPLEDAATNRNFAQQMLSPANTAKMRLIMSPGEYKFFERALRKESELFQRGSKVLGGSRTAPLAEGMAQLDSMIAGGKIEDAVNFVLAGPQGRFATLARWVSNLQPNKEFGDKVYTQLGKALSANDPDKLRDVLDMLARSNSYAQLVADTKRVATGPVAAVAGNVAPSVVEDRSPNIPPVLRTGGEEAPDDVLEEARRALEMPIGGEEPTTDGLMFEGVAEEGNAPFSGKPSLGERNLNRGNIKDGPWARSQPGYAGRGEDGFARFESVEAGDAAQLKLIGQKYNKGARSVGAMIDSYLGGDPANTPESTRNYKNYVAKRLGVGVNDRVSPRMLSALSQAMIEFETGKRAK